MAAIYAVCWLGMLLSIGAIITAAILAFNNWKEP